MGTGCSGNTCGHAVHMYSRRVTYYRPPPHLPCRSDFVYDLFEHMSVSESGGGRKTTTMVGKRGGKPSRKKATVSSQFKVNLCTTYVTDNRANLCTWPIHDFFLRIWKLWLTILCMAAWSGDEAPSPCLSRLTCRLHRPFSNYAFTCQFWLCIKCVDLAVFKLCIKRVDFMIWALF
jgi:hypothetical protein